MQCIQRHLTETQRKQEQFTGLESLSCGCGAVSTRHSLVSVLRATSVTLARNKGTAPWRSGAVVMETKQYTKQESHVGGRGVNVSVRSNIREKKEQHKSVLRPFTFSNMQYAEQHVNYSCWQYRRRDIQH
jgi:hypothetical protein